jgi:Zn-dependent protease
VNLFNLMPIVPLDGGRGFRALDRGQRLLTVPVIFAAWYLTSEGLLILLLIVALLRAVEATATPTHDARAFTVYAGLVVGLSLIATTAGQLVTSAMP